MLSWRILQITVYYKELLTINCQGTNHPRSILSFMDISRRSLVTHSAHWGRLCSVVCLSVLPFPFLTLVTLSLLFVPPSARSLGSSSVLPSCPSFTRHERTKGVSDEWGARMTSASHLSYRSPSHRRLSWGEREALVTSLPPAARIERWSGTKETEPNDTRR